MASERKFQLQAQAETRAIKKELFEIAEERTELEDALQDALDANGDKGTSRHERRPVHKLSCVERIHFVATTIEEEKGKHGIHVANQSLDEDS